MAMWERGKPFATGVAESWSALKVYDPKGFRRTYDLPDWLIDRIFADHNAAEALAVAVDNLTVVKVRAGRLMDEGDNSWLAQNLYAVASDALAQIAKLSQATDSKGGGMMVEETSLETYQFTERLGVSDQETQGWRKLGGPFGAVYLVVPAVPNGEYHIGPMLEEHADLILAALQRPSREAALIEALTSLYDEQNGAPLWRDRYSWAEAMAKAKALISPP